MTNILVELFNKYNIVYDRKYKILFIHKAISVRDFVYLKALLALSMYDIEDIRVY